MVVVGCQLFGEEQDREKGKSQPRKQLWLDIVVHTLFPMLERQRQLDV